MLPLFLFQSTLPRGERLNSIPVIASRHNFNPRSREGSDHYILGICGVRGNFNPRSREGSDKFFVAKCILQNYFNPRSREGSDDEYLKEIGGVKRISIHAPARGATAGERVKLLLAMHFNPRSREGSDRFQHS